MTQIFEPPSSASPLIAAAMLYLCVTIRMTRIVDRLQVRSLRERGAAVAFGPH